MKIYESNFDILRFDSINYASICNCQWLIGQDLPKLTSHASNANIFKIGPDKTTLY